MNAKKQNKSETKDYLVKIDGEKYNLIIEFKNTNFNFKLEPKGNLILYFYKGEFILSSVANKMNIVINNQNPLEQLDKIIEKSINDNSLKIVHDKEKKKMIIRFNKNMNDFSSDFELEEFSNKKKLFNNIFEELNLLKFQQTQYLTLFKNSNFISHKDAINLINENNSKNDFENKIKSIDNICKSQNDEIAKIKSNIENKIKNKEVNELKSEINNIKENSSNKINNDEINEIKNEINNLKNHINFNQENNKKEISEIKNDFNNKIKSLNFNEINNIKNDIESKFKSFDLEEIKNEIKNLKIDLDNKSKNINIKELKQKTNKTISDIDNEEKDNKNEIINLKNDFFQLKEKQVTLDKENKELKKEILKMKEEQITKENELKNEIKILKEENQILKSEKEKEKEKEKSQKENKKNNDDKIGEEILSIKQMNNKLNEDKINLEKELSELKSKISMMIKKEKKNEEKFNKEKLNHEFNISPDKLQNKFDILDTNNIFFIDEFAAYISITDKREYLASGNKGNYNIDIYNLTNNVIHKSLKAHNNGTPTVRYFLDKNKKKEYLISADFLKAVIVWDIGNEYNILLKITDSKYKGSILSTILYFDVKSNENKFFDYVITSSDDENDDFSKIYSLSDGSFVKDISNTNKNSSYYLLSWEYNDNYYIIELCLNKISINNLLTEENYAELISPPESSHFGGFIYKTNYLCCSSENGYIRIWDLVNKSIFKTIEMKGSCYFEILSWNEKYIISANYKNNSFDIFNLEKGELYKQVKTSHSSGVRAVKKIFHSTYGECLITSGHDSVIKLWSI